MSEQYYYECHKCGKEFIIADAKEQCPHCGSEDIELVDEPEIKIWGGLR